MSVNNQIEVIDSIIKTTLINNSALDSDQIKALKDSLELTLSKYNIMEDITKADMVRIQEANAKILRDFINAKGIEGRSHSTLYAYAKEVSKMFMCINKPLDSITATDIRDYMAFRKTSGNLKAQSIANIRLYLMSFFKWCYTEEIIRKNPMDRIGVIKVEDRIIETLSDEEQEIIRCACNNERDLAIIDLLSGSGMRVSELVGLNIEDVNFQSGELKVFGKGSKERICFLTGRSKVHLRWYLESRDDDNPALFVTAKKPFERMTKAGVEYVLRNIAKKSNIPSIRLYPHKFRSTLATNMINKGAAAEHVQGILGHSNVNTTLKNYARIDKDTYKRAHRQFA